MSDSQDPNQDQNPEQEEPKLVVDSDWKEQVAKEKQQAAEAPSESSSDAEGKAEGNVTDSVTEAPEAVPPTAQAPPPASFEVLISMLFTQAMMMLGQMPDPASGKSEINKPFAKHHIDTLEMLSEKTKGNLSDDEAKMLSEALHALRMMYVNVKA
ncbi:hypothetical protein Q31b_12520 [Novipirellula aureliae]|uniref:DUF1844 domain-containing protein n=1 Tax=Novipirellula aureliae TaxID=2527966 RepID=A0A5C6E259_9BACT|nr:DUF1844 domain-containing protein [Novipirellula aureliae]TWU43723.1 hypothetical protein Q31b_12520 [Novipirellula aureliae]